MPESVAMPQLLILDFDGVCTLSAAESIEHAIDPGDDEAIVRSEASEIVRQAQSAGIPVYVLSNEVAPHLVDTLSILTSVDRVVLCSDNGIYKPDRRAFQRCLLLSGVEASEAVLVDDDPDNVKVARSLGVAAVHFDRSVADPWQTARELLVLGDRGDDHDEA